MVKVYMRLDFFYGKKYQNISFKEIIELLLKAKDNGDLVYYEYNGHKYYSDTFNLEDLWNDYYKVNNIVKSKLELTELKKLEYILLYSKGVVREDKYEDWINLVLDSYNKKNLLSKLYMILYNNINNNQIEYVEDMNEINKIYFDIKTRKKAI